MRLIILMIPCYRFIALPSLLITFISSAVIYQSEDPLSLVAAIWTKMITTCLLLLFLYFFRASQFFFFNNLGYSNRTIYSNLVIMDFTVAAVSFSMTLILL